METVIEFVENLKCPITRDPVAVSDGTVYERVAIRNHLAAKREEGEAPRGPTTNQPLLPMRHEGKYGAEDEDACFYPPACDFFLTYRIQAQPALPLEYEGLQGVPTELTPYTVIIDPQTNFPIPSWTALFLRCRLSTFKHGFALATMTHKHSWRAT